MTCNTDPLAGSWTVQVVLCASTIRPLGRRWSQLWLKTWREVWKTLSTVNWTFHYRSFKILVVMYPVIESPVWKHHFHWRQKKKKRPVKHMKLYNYIRSSIITKFSTKVCGTTLADMDLCRRCQPGYKRVDCMFPHVHPISYTRFVYEDAWLSCHTAL